MKAKGKTALKVTAGTTATGGLLGGIIAPTLLLNKTQRENEDLQKEIENLQRQAREAEQPIPVPAPAGANLSEKELEDLKQKIKANDGKIADLGGKITGYDNRIKELEEQVKAKDGWLAIKDGTIKSLQQKVVTLEKQVGDNQKSLELLDKIQKKNPLTAPNGCWLSLNKSDKKDATEIAMNCPLGFYYTDGKEAPGTFTFWAKKSEHKSTFDYFMKLYEVYNSGTITSGR